MKATAVRAYELIRVGGELTGIVATLRREGVGPRAALCALGAALAAMGEEAEAPVFMEGPTEAVAAVRAYIRGEEEMAALCRTEEVEA